MHKEHINVLKVMITQPNDNTTKLQKVVNRKQK